MHDIVLMVYYEYSVAGNFGEVFNLVLFGEFG